MKQTIISKCFSKMKRIMLTLFAALCVGSVWAGYLTFEAQNFAVSEDGTITFNANLGYHGTDTDRYAQLTAVGYNANGEVAFQETKVIGEELTELKLEEDGEGDGCVTYPCTIVNSGLSATESYKIEFHFWAVKADGSLSADYDITQYVLPPIGVTGITAKYGDLKFRVFGNIESGYNVSAIKVSYILGTGTPNLVTEATIDAEAGTFACEIPYTPNDYTLTYKVTVEYADGTSKDYLNPATGVADLVKTRRTVDNIKVIYTWTGEGDGTSWTDELNWTVNSDEDTVGYPGTHDGSYYRTMFAITKDVECIDLKGGTYGFVDDGAMYIAPNTTVKFKNGKFRFTSSEISRATVDASGASDELIGSNGGTLIFEKVYLRSCKDNGTESGNLAIVPRTGATIVFEGTYSDTWDYYPKSANTGTKIIIRDGELTLSRNLNGSANGSQNDVLISNAKWNINNASSKTITPYKTLIFRDGPDRQAQIVNTGDLKLAGTYDFALPATPYSTPYYKLRKLSATTAGTIKVDVTNYKGGDLVPLIAFSGTLNDNTKTAMNTITTTASKLKVTANGVDVKATRNAKLVWNESKKTLYFQQDSQNAAEVGGVEYASFAEAFAAAQAGDTVTLYQDVELSEILVINKAITLDGNGCTLTSIAARAINVSGVDGVTIKNLTISASGERAINVIQGATNVKIENVTATAYNYTVNIASSAANAVVAINNSTLNGLCTVNVAAAGAKVTIDGSTVNCNDNNTNAGESYAALCLGKEAVGASIVATNTVVNVTEGSDSVKARNGAENGTITIDDSTDNVTEAVAVISYAGQNFYHSFNTLEDAIGFAKDADTITILKDIATDVAFTVAKKVTIDLNGKTIATTQADTEGNGVFWVKAGGELTLNGEGTVNGVGGNAYNIAIWADGGKVIINGGTYTNVGAKDDGPDGAHFDLIYVKNGGAVEINGGTFKCQTPNWTLNSHDTAKGTIVVNGGFFYQFNPGDCATEGAGTNWCADGLRGVESAEKPGYYTVEEYSWVAPMPEKDGDAGFTAEYTAEVLAALEANAATSVAVKVNGDALKGDAAVNALNTAVKCFEGALVFDGTAADLDIVIEVVEVNVEDPAASKVVVKRGETVLAVKTGVTPTVKYVDLGSDAVTFKIVFE